MTDRVAIVGIVGVPGNYGGFETMVDNLVDAEKTEFTVYCSSYNYKDQIKNYKNAKLVYIRIKANGVFSILYDIFSILHAVISGHKTILILGVSGAILIPFIRILPLKIRIITNIDGIEWKRDKWNSAAKFFLKFSEKLAVNYSSIVIADNDAIGEYIKNDYGKKAEIIAYGGDNAISNCNENYLFKKPYDSYALSLCRIEPENNIELILKSFSLSKENIIFIGNWNSSSYGMRIKEDYIKFPNIKILDPIYDSNILYQYRSNCAVYIHGHSAGGTNPSLVEMMHFSKPIIAFDCSFNRETLENNGSFFKSQAELNDIILKFSNLDSGKIFKNIADRRYTWEIINKQYTELFNKES